MGFQPYGELQGGLSKDMARWREAEIRNERYRTMKEQIRSKLVEEFSSEEVEIFERIDERQDTLYEEYWKEEEEYNDLPF